MPAVGRGFENVMTNAKRRNGGVSECVCRLGNAVRFWVRSNARFTPFFRVRSSFAGKRKSSGFCEIPLTASVSSHVERFAGTGTPFLLRSIAAGIAVSVNQNAL